jgi:hypothetical protein
VSAFLERTVGVDIVIVEDNFALRLRSIVEASAALAILKEWRVVKAPGFFSFFASHFNPTVNVAQLDLFHNGQVIKFIKELDPIGSCLDFVKALKVALHFAILG